MSIDTSNTSELTVEVSEAPVGNMGQKLLISGNAMSLRLWDEQPEDGQHKSATARNYETLGYVIKGKAELTVEGKTIVLEPGVSWAVPEGKEHFYKIIKPFRAVEATHPSARGDG